MTGNFIFICGPDDFLAARAAKQKFDAHAADIADEFSREVISGFAGNVGEVEAAVNRFRESAQTISMFGGKRAIWFKDINFLADTATGRSEGTLKQVEALQEILEKLDPAHASVILSAAPVDRRRAFLKWCEKNSEFLLIGDLDKGDVSGLAQVVQAEAAAMGVTITPDALGLLLSRIGANSRLLLEEVRKLSAYAGDNGDIDASAVEELTPNVAEGDFFEGAEAFFSGNLDRTLNAFHRHFFLGGDARPLLVALQNRNRILIQIRALMDAGDVKVGPRGLDAPAFARAGEKYADAFAGSSEKNSYNVFTQNPWYLGKLSNGGQISPLRRLIDSQQEFIRAFTEIISRPNEQEDVLRDLAVRCLT